MRAILIFFCLLIMQLATAQTSKTLTGTVYFQDTGEPVPFAYVKLEGVAYGTVTDFDGTYSLKIPARYLEKKIEFSYTGLKTTLVPIATHKVGMKTYMETDIKQLYTVVVTAKREPNPKGILRKAINAISENFVDQPFNLSGFYREYVEENSTPVKYADAAFMLDLKPYTGKQEKNKRFENPVEMTGITTVGSWSSRSSSMHRWHFHQKVLKGEKAQIIATKASEDWNTTRLYANIQGGPLSALTKDKVKYPANFLTKFSKYNYDMVQVEKGGELYYLISFSPDISIEKMEGKNRPFNYEYKLGGTVLIKKEDLAIVEISYSVPPAFKKFICGYRNWSIRHFDFSVTSKYEKVGDKYALAYLKHADEFIVEDTAANRRVPYAAISEFYTHDVEVAERVAISKDENFSNSDYTFLFDHAEGYDSAFWASFESAHPEAQVPEQIYASLNERMPLEKQFANKLIRDTTLLPPVAKKDPVQNELHGQKWTDDYAWMKDTKNPRGNMEIMQYLSDENAYTTNYFKPLKPLQKALLRELKSYVPKNYSSLPTAEGGYNYYYSYRENDEYPIYYRKKIEGDSEPELLFDINKMAEDHAYYAMTGLSLSPSNKLIAFMENKTAKDRWVLKFKNLETDVIMPMSVDYVSGMVWLTDSTLAVTEVDPKTFRAGKVSHYNLLTAKKTLIYEEPDKRFSVGVGKSRSRAFVFLGSSSSNESEIRVLNLKNPTGPWKLIAPRRENHLYSVSHFEDKFYILTNHKAVNRKLMETDTSQVEEKYWKVKIPESSEHELISILPFKDWTVFQERHGLTYKLKVVEKATGKEHYIKQAKNSMLSLGVNKDFDTETLQIQSSSYNRRTEIYNYDFSKKKLKSIKTIGQFSPIFFSKVETIYAKAKDGTEIPITLIYNNAILKRMKEKGETPRLFITGYGSYGSSNLPGYVANLSPLISKGIVYAIAHVRGGGDLGEDWYKEGKMLQKKNTFTDFISCTEHLIAAGYGEAGKVIAQGGSAGGLLMGAVANMRPDLYNLMILDVPFVDVVNTMLDDKLPLTSMEYEEWGNPNEKKYFKYIKSYSPYDNVKAQDYPNMLFLTAVNDTRVGYWEPAKMVARLRSLKTDQNELLLRTDFSAGHGGASGRYASLSATALKFALILEMVSKSVE